MRQRLLSLLFFIPILANGQFCEDFNTHTKTQLLTSGWESWPSAAWSISTTGAYDYKSAVVNTGVGSTIMLASPCLYENSTSETFSLYYNFSYGSGMFRVGMQSPNNAIGTGVTWLDTMPVVNSWTFTSVNFTPAYNPYKILLWYGNVTVTTKFGVDNFCLAHSTNLGLSCSLMPVEITGFTAKAIDNPIPGSKTKIELEWQTASESNSCCYTVLRSQDDINFDSVAAVKATGYSTIPVSYSYEDIVSNTGEIYYRLKSVDNDGSYSLTDVVSVLLQGQPHWFVSDGLLHYTGTGTHQLMIYYITGQLAYTETLEGDIQQDLHFLPRGFYLLKLSDSSCEVTSFVIL